MPAKREKKEAITALIVAFNSATEVRQLLDIATSILHELEPVTYRQIYIPLVSNSIKVMGMDINEYIQSVMNNTATAASLQAVNLSLTGLLNLVDISDLED